MITVISEQEKALRELRLWHYEQCAAAFASAQLRTKEGNLKASKFWVRQAEFHQSAVAALDAAVTGTAEEDAKL